MPSQTKTASTEAQKEEVAEESQQLPLVEEPGFHTVQIKAMAGLEVCETCGDQYRLGMGGLPLCPIQSPDCDRHQSPD